MWIVCLNPAQSLKIHDQGVRAAIDDAAKIHHAMSEDRRHTADELTAQAQEDGEY
jgi:DUF917 family protein